MVSWLRRGHLMHARFASCKRISASINLQMVSMIVRRATVMLEPSNSRTPIGATIMYVLPTRKLTCVHARDGPLLFKYQQAGWFEITKYCYDVRTKWLPGF